MAQFQKPQSFPYSYKSISAPVDSILFVPEIGIQMVLPLNLFQIEQWLMRVRVQFDPTLTTAQKTLTRIRVQQINVTTGVLIKNVLIPLSKPAVSNILDFNFDLSTYIDRKNDNIIWLGFGTTPDNFTINPYNTTTNTLRLWHVDMGYTSKGVY